MKNILLRLLDILSIAILIIIIFYSIRLFFSYNFSIYNHTETRVNINNIKVSYGFVLSSPEWIDKINFENLEILPLVINKYFEINFLIHTKNDIKNLSCKVDLIRGNDDCEIHFYENLTVICEC